MRSVQKKSKNRQKGFMIPILKNYIEDIYLNDCEYK